MLRPAMIVEWMLLPTVQARWREPRLYQLIRQKGQVKDRTFEIEFMDSGVQAFSFTFG